VPTILNVAYPLAPVGPDAVGGAEQIVTLLDDAIVRAGWRSIVIAAEGSVTRGMLIPTPLPDGPLGEDARIGAQERHRAAIEAVLCERSVDLVHLHGVDFHRYLPPPGVPVLVTLHLPPSFYPPEAFRPARPETFLHCVSWAQHAACLPGARLLPPIENGVPVGDFGARVRRRDFALALGRICPDKGFHLALDAARRAAVPLLLAGRVFRYAEHEAYFYREIAPRLDALRRFIGPVSRRRKRRLLAAARCLVVPSLVPETSSLVAMEALASGTPVVAFAIGALADIVEHGVTGFLVRDEREMVDALRAVDAIDPARCREAARARFSAERMTGEYLDLYRRIIAGRASLSQW
jgi:glycosyltransferase involved in cell wall biosynthesis